MLKRFSLPHALICLAPVALLGAALLIPATASAAVVAIGRPERP